MRRRLRVQVKTSARKISITRAPAANRAQAAAAQAERGPPPIATKTTAMTRLTRAPRVRAELRATPVPAVRVALSRARAQVAVPAKPELAVQVPVVKAAQVAQVPAVKVVQVAQVAQVAQAQAVKVVPVVQAQVPVAKGVPAVRRAEQARRVQQAAQVPPVTRCFRQLPGSATTSAARARAFHRTVKLQTPARIRNLTAASRTRL